MAAQSPATPRRTAKRLEDSLASRPIHGPKTPGPLDGVVRTAQEKPYLVAASLLFLIGAFVTGLIINLARTENQRAADTAYAAALFTEEPAMRASALLTVADQHASIAAEAVYMAAESYYAAGKPGEAETAFTRVRTDFPDSPYVGRATEGLGFIAEDRAAYSEAIGYYEEAATSADEFTARRQQYNIGRVKEKMSDFPGAVAAYEEQAVAFPGSSIALSADAAVSRLKAAHPDIFPPEAIAETTGEPAGASTLFPDVAPAEAEPAAAEEAPATASETAPVEEAPAAEAPAAEPATEEAAPAAETPQQ